MIKLLTNESTAGGGSVSTFQWSTSEQIWPFEKASSGATLYCKEINFGALPNAGTKTVAHGISSLDKTKVFLLRGHYYFTNYTQSSTLPYVDQNSTYNTSVLTDGNDIKISTLGNMSDQYARMRIIYAK